MWTSELSISAPQFTAVTKSNNVSSGNFIYEFKELRNYNSLKIPSYSHLIVSHLLLKLIFNPVSPASLLPFTPVTLLNGNNGGNNVPSDPAGEANLTILGLYHLFVLLFQVCLQFGLFTAPQTPPGTSPCTPPPTFGFAIYNVNQRCQKYGPGYQNHTFMFRKCFVK